MTDSYQDLSYEVHAGVARITLQRPAKLNAWTEAMDRSMRLACARAASDDAVRVIVITGAGRGFCAGADMNRLQDISNVAESTSGFTLGPPPENTGDPELAGRYSARFGFLLANPKPIIAAINGACAGLGLVLALFCDLRFAKEDAKLTTSFAQRGLIAEHGAAWLLPRLIGPAHAFDLLLSARQFTGREAERLGLVNRAFAADSFDREVQAYAERLSREVSPRSLRVMKAQLWKALYQDFGTALELADREMNASFGTADFKEGVAHFVEKRPAKFTGT